MVGEGRLKKEMVLDMNVLPTTGSRLEGETDQPYADEHRGSETKVSAQPRDTTDERAVKVPHSEEEEVKVGKRTVGAGVPQTCG